MSIAPAPLIVTADVRAKLERLRDFAARRPVDVAELLRANDDRASMAAHRKRMTAQTINVPGPWPFFVTFSVETGHPAGTCRHLSMSLIREGRAPSPEAVWMIAEIMGFTGSIQDCRLWLEDLTDEHGGQAVNLVQPLMSEAGHA
jgi:hypothetical protein